MNAWNSSFVRQNWERQSTGHLVRANGRTVLQATNVAAAYRSIVAENGGVPEDTSAALVKAKELSTQDAYRHPFPFQSASRGLFMMMLSELGRREELNDLLDFADQKLSPKWERGGLFYPRKDDFFDSAGDYVHVEPHSGNSAIGYARLNVEDGQKIMWEHPWTKEGLNSRPWVEGCSLGDDVDFLRGVWDTERRAAIVTLKSWEGDFEKPKDVRIVVRGLPMAEWAIYVNGDLQHTTDVDSNGTLEVKVAVAPSEEVDVVVCEA